MNDEPKDFRKSMRWSRKGEKKNMVEGWVVVSFGWGGRGAEAKNKTGDEERK